MCSTCLSFEVIFFFLHNYICICETTALVYWESRWKKTTYEGTTGLGKALEEDTKYFC